MFEHYKKLIHIRRDNPILQYGAFNTLLADDEKDLFIFERSYEKEKLIVVINNSDQTQEIVIPGLTGNCLDLISNTEFKADNKKSVKKKWGLLIKTCTTRR